MKNLEDHKILYDEVCPMCDFYSGAFVKTGMLPKDGRLPYQQLPEGMHSVVDCRRAVNEIALVNTKTGQVAYGVQSLFLILQHSFPVLKPLFRSKSFFWLADKAYKFVSYNRRLIMPAQVAITSSLNEPAFHRAYRLLYLLLAWLFTATFLNQYSVHLQPLIPVGNFYREWLICGGQILWQSAILRIGNAGNRRDYLGNMMTISLVGALALLLVLAVGSFFSFGPHFYAGAFLFVAGLMLVEHMRRVKLLGLNWILTLSWAVYRLVVLFLILNV